MASGSEDAAVTGNSSMWPVSGAAGEGMAASAVPVEPGRESRPVATSARVTMRIRARGWQRGTEAYTTPLCDGQVEVRVTD